MDDRRLLERIARGDDAAFAAFYRAHLNAVVAFLRRRVPDPELAFDLAAETFAVVAARAGSYDGAGEPAAWLFGIARNKLRESLRRGRVEASARVALGLEPIALTDRDLERVEERAAPCCFDRLTPHRAGGTPGPPGPEAAAPLRTRPRSASSRTASGPAAPTISHCDAPAGSRTAPRPRS